MLDLSLLKSPSFMLLAISGFLCMMGFFVPFLYLAARAKENGMDTNLATLTISVIGISNTVARIFCGFISSFESVDANILSNVAITVGGLATMFSGIIITPAVQFTYSIIFGLAIGKRYSFSLGIWKNRQIGNTGFFSLSLSLFFCSLFLCITFYHCC